MTGSTSHDTRLLPVTVLAIGIAALGLTSCGASNASGSSTTTGSAASSAPAASPATTASSQASAPPASARPIDVCATVPAATAAKLSGKPFTKGVPRGGLQPEEYGCAYGNDDDSLQMEVTVFEHNAAESYNFFFSGSKNARAVNGLGDKAFFDNDGTMYVLVGNNLIQVNGLETADQCAALARPVVAALAAIR
jgi:hypothetical protein